VSTLPFAPLTLGELLDRGREAREMCGYWCATVVRSGLEFDAYDLEKLRGFGVEAVMLADALRARLEVASG